MISQHVLIRNLLTVDEATSSSDNQLGKNKEM
jgi:hypothetical protein